MSGSFYLSLSKYLGSGWLYQKTKATLWSPTSGDLSDSTVKSPLNNTRKKLQRPKVVKIPNVAFWKWHFSPDDLGLQQSLCNTNSSLGIFMSKYQRTNFLNSDWRINQTILVTSFWLFSRSKFGWNQLEVVNVYFSKDFLLHLNRATTHFPTWNKPANHFGIGTILCFFRPWILGGSKNRSNGICLISRLSLSERLNRLGTSVSLSPSTHGRHSSRSVNAEYFLQNFSQG